MADHLTEISKAARRVVAVLDRAEEARQVPEKYRRHDTGRIADNAIFVPVAVLRQLRQALGGAKCSR